MMEMGMSRLVMRDFKVISRRGAKGMGKDMETKGMDRVKSLEDSTVFLSIWKQRMRLLLNKHTKRINQLKLYLPKSRLIALWKYTLSIRTRVRMCAMIR